MTACASVKSYPLKRATDIRLPMTVMVCAALLCATHARAETPSACSTPTTLQVVQLMNSWRAGLASGSPDRMASFYAEDASLVATKDGAPLKGRQAIRIYFGDLLPRHPDPRIISRNITPGCNAASVKGVVFYRITGKRKGTRMLLGGRYTVDFAFRNNTWLIVNQTLAADPRKIGEPLASASN
jgi:uncharacterized protein (TIGR02246 family)